MPAPLMLSWKDPTTKTQQSITRSSSLTNNASSPMETDGNPNLLATLSLKSATFDPWTKYTPLLITRHLHSLELLNSISIMKHTTTQQFDFAAKPKVTAVKPKYREETRLDGTNLMNDPRVVRGNTYAAIVENKNDIQPPPRKPPQELPKRKERVTSLSPRESILTLVLRPPLPEQSMDEIISVFKPIPSWRPSGTTPYNTRRKVKLIYSSIDLSSASSIRWKARRESTGPPKSKKMTPNSSISIMKFNPSSMYLWFYQGSPQQNHRNIKNGALLRKRTRGKREIKRRIRKTTACQTGLGSETRSKWDKIEGIVW